MKTKLTHKTTPLIIIYQTVFYCISLVQGHKNFKEKKSYRLQDEHPLKNGGFLYERVISRELNQLLIAAQTRF